MENQLVPYEAATALPARRALVLAPHADDEVFGCGGAIAAHVRAGVPVDVVILTDGARFGEPSARADESRAAAAVLGYGEPEFWSLPDRALAYDEALVRRIADAITASGADLVYAPSPWEIHPDHRQAAAIAIEAVRRTGTRLACYEVGSPLPPNLLLDISALAETKKKAMQCFASQLEKQDYERQIRALNEYRSYTLPHGVIAAEAYLLLSAAELDSALPAALMGHPVAAGGKPSAGAIDTGSPLVSILVRSLDREHLHEALDSVSLQGYPNIEVVVVAAKPGHRPLAPRCGPFPVRLIETEAPLARSRTANRALDAARGEYLLFLDDDDWLLPGHVARLAQVLRRQPGSLAAYTGVALVGPRGEPQGQVMDLPFDGIRQLAGNLTPIHAVLFSRKLVAGGCRFDESLDRYEDWDFWLQASRRTHFAHVPGVSAAYRIHESSGVHSEGGPAGEATQAIYRKWQAAWSIGQMAQLMQHVWSGADREVEVGQVRDELVRTQLEAQRQAAIAGQQADTLRQQADTIKEQAGTIEQQAGAIARQSGAVQELLAASGQLRAQLEHRLTELRDRDARIAAYLASTSWKVTAPLRWLKRKARRSGS